MQYEMTQIANEVGTPLKLSREELKRQVFRDSRIKAGKEELRIMGI